LRHRHLSLSGASNNHNALASKPGNQTPLFGAENGEDGAVLLPKKVNSIPHKQQRGFEDQQLLEHSSSEDSLLGKRIMV
jgi:hypothetical protein